MKWWKELPALLLVNFIDFIEKPITKNNEFNSVKSTQEVGVYSEVCHALALAERDCWQKY